MCWPAFCLISLCVCVHIWFCVWVCESAFRWMNYPLPTFRAWQSSICDPWRTLVSQSLSLRTLPCVICNGFFAEMTEWPLKRISAFLFTMSMIEVLLWCTCVRDRCALKAAGCYIPGCTLLFCTFIISFIMHYGKCWSNVLWYHYIKCLFFF